MKVLKFWKPIIIASIIFYGSLTPGNNLNQFGLFSIPNIDKFIHFLFYFSLSLTFITSLYKVSKLSKTDLIFITLIYTISYGILMEVLQFYISLNRSAEILDALSNTLGSIAGILFFQYLKLSRWIKYL
jgi:VanZ family protein